MCLAVLVQQGSKLPMEVFDKASFNNSDGFGYAFVHNGEVVVRKVTAASELEMQFVKEHNAHYKSSPFLIHFRYATHGEVCMRNTHPFMLSNGGAIIHNGILPINPAKNTRDSDTRHFVRQFLNKLPDNWHKSEYILQVVAEAIGKNNKLALLMPDKSYVIINESQGNWINGIWYSNASGQSVNYWCATAATKYDDDYSYSPTRFVTTNKESDTLTGLGNMGWINIIDRLRADFYSDDEIEEIISGYIYEGYSPVQAEGLEDVSSRGGTPTGEWSNSRAYGGF